MHNWLDRILHHGLTHPETPAIVLIDRVVTYGMLRDAVVRCAGRLIAQGLPQAGPVGVLLESPVRQLALCFALHRIGIPSLPLERGDGLVAQLSLGALITDENAEIDSVPGTRRVQATDAWFAEDPPVTHALPATNPDPDWICRYTLTSGTTGNPKLVAYTLSDVCDHLTARVLTDTLSSRNSVMVMPGTSSNVGFSSCCAVLLAGRTLYLSQSLEHSARMIELYRVDTLWLSPEQLLALIRVVKRTRARMTSLAAVKCGGERMSQVLIEQALAHVCRHLEISYGTSEIGRIATVSAADILVSPGLAGFPMPGVEVSIRDQDGAPLPRNEIGTIAIRKQTLKSKALASGRSDGWASPGDIGWLDDAGRLFIGGRTSDGQAVAKGVSRPLEVEQLVKLEFDFDDASAIEFIGKGAAGGRPEIWLAVVGQHRPETGRIEARLQQRGIDCSIRLFAVPAIPRGVNGKVRRGELKAILMAQSVAFTRH